MRVIATPGWVNFDNSLSVRAARWPTLVPALARLRVLSPESADLARAAEARGIRFADAAARAPAARWRPSTART